MISRLALTFMSVTVGCCLAGATFRKSDDPMDQIIANAAANELPALPTLTSTDLADLMIEIRKLGGTSAAVAIFDIIDSCGMGYATRTTEVLNGLLCQCTSHLADRVVEDILAMWVLTGHSVVLGAERSVHSAECSVLSETVDVGCTICPFNCLLYQCTSCLADMVVRGTLSKADCNAGCIIYLDSCHLPVCYQACIAACTIKREL